jgi:hypothetical protein
MHSFVFVALLAGALDLDQLRITVYDRSGLDAETRARAFDEVTRLLRAAGIHVIWVEGNNESIEGKLLTYPERSRKGSEAEAACRARTDVALDLLQNTPEGVKPTIAGLSQPFATEGLNVRMFTQTVIATAQRENRPVASVAGHVMAHEIGHVLLRTHKHAKSGLMANLWAAHEYGRMASGTLLFSAGEATTMRATLNRTGCTRPDQDPSRPVIGNFVPAAKLPDTSCRRLMASSR